MDLCEEDPNMLCRRFVAEYRLSIQYFFKKEFLTEKSREPYIERLHNKNLAYEIHWGYISEDNIGVVSMEEIDLSLVDETFSTYLVRDDILHIIIKMLTLTKNNFYCRKQIPAGLVIFR